jgi:hypothetical protein
MLPEPDWFKHGVTFAGVRGPVSLFSHLLANPRRLKVKVSGICIQMSNWPFLVYKT